MINEIPVLADAEVVSRGQRGGRRFSRRPSRANNRKPGDQLRGLAGTPYWTSRDAVAAIAAPPESLCVVGGGTVGVELAQGFAREGTRVRIIECAERLLPREEPETAELLTAVLVRQGVQVDTASTVRSVRHSGDLFTLRVAGRVPDEPPGDRVEVQRLLVPADLSLSLGRTADGVGDGDGPGSRALPRVTYTDPALGAVGLTEAQAREQGLPVRVGLSWMDWADGFVKLIEDAGSGALLGATVTGPLSLRMVSELTTAVQAATVTRQLAQLMDPGSPRCRSVIENTLAELH